MESVREKHTSRLGVVSPKTVTENTWEVDFHVLGSMHYSMYSSVCVGFEVDEGMKLRMNLSIH